MAQLREPHIIPVHDYGELDGRLFLEMRLVDGLDLGTLLRRDGPMAAERAVAIVEQSAAALDAAHAHGLVHRDVKPANVLVTPGPPEFVSLLDFGIARSTGTTLGGRLTRTGFAVGTVGYMAPERLLDQHVGRPADVYALACILFELLTGAQPFTGDTATVVHGHVHRPVPPLRAFRADLPAALDAVIAGGAAKDPQYRYATAGALAAAARAAVRRRSPRSSRPSSPRPSLLGRAPHRRRRTGSGVRPSRRRCTRPGWRRPWRGAPAAGRRGSGRAAARGRLRGRRRTLPGHRDRGRRGPAVGRGDHRSAPRSRPSRPARPRPRRRPGPRRR